MYSKTAIARCSQPICGCRKNSFVWVSHKSRVIWYEIPKAASSSIKEALYIWGESNINDYSFVNLDLTPIEAARRYPEYYKFAVVRNPWDKMVSLWHMFCVQIDSFRNDQIKQLFGMEAPEIDFATFIELAIRNANHHWEEAIRFLPIDSFSSLQLDETIQLDSLEESLSRLSDNIAGFDLKMKKLNMTDHQHYSYYYDETLKKKVGSMFENDINTFNFRFLDEPV